MLPRIRVGFTMVELLVVIAIILLLATLLLPALARAQEKGRQTACISNLQQIHKAIDLWSQDHSESYPNKTIVWDDMHEALSKKVFICPTKGPSQKNGYGYSTFVAGMPLAKVTRSSEELLAADCTVECNNLITYPTDIDFRHAERYSAVYCDGHAESMATLPAMWKIELSSTVTFDREVLQNPLPVMLYFYTDGTDGSEGEKAFCEKLSPVVAEIAANFRGRLQVVTIKGSIFTDLLTTYKVTPKDVKTGYPAIIFLDNGTEVQRYSGTPDTKSRVDEYDWTFLAQEWKEKMTDEAKTLTK